MSFDLIIGCDPDSILGRCCDCGRPVYDAEKFSFYFGSKFEAAPEDFSADGIDGHQFGSECLEKLLLKQITEYGEWEI